MDPTFAEWVGAITGLIGAALVAWKGHGRNTVLWPIWYLTCF